MCIKYTENNSNLVIVTVACRSETKGVVVKRFDSIKMGITIILNFMFLMVSV